MDISLIALIGGIWLSLLYSATVMPATVWVIQVTVSRNWRTGLAASAGLSLGQMPWCLLAGLMLFQFPRFWQDVDLGLRAVSAIFLIWMAYRTFRAGTVGALKLDCPGPSGRLAWLGFRRSLAMPWRLPVWAVLIISVGAHLRGPGWPTALAFSVGSLIGQLAWHTHFILVAGLFGHRVPEDISLHSLNKLRLLASLVLAGLAMIILAPLAFPPM